MLKKSLLLIALSIGLSTELVLTNLVAVARPTSRPTRSTSVVRPGNNKKARRGSILGFNVPKIRASGNREGGAARGEGCGQDADLKAITPPAPKDWDVTKAPIENTISDHPTFFVNVPESSAKQVEFVLRDGDEQELVRETIDIGSSKGLIAYTLPKSFKGLEVGKKYVWRFSLLCNAQDRSGNPKVSALVQRIEPSQQVAQELAEATDDLDRLSIYSNNGFWHETLKTLVDLRAANPNNQDLAKSWENVFQSVGFKALAQEPVFLLTGVSSDSLD
jgi:hypothetical protein